MSAPQMDSRKRGRRWFTPDKHSDYQNHILYSQNTTLQELFVSFHRSNLLQVVCIPLPSPSPSHSILCCVKTIAFKATHPSHFHTFTSNPNKECNQLLTEGEVHVNLPFFQPPQPPTHPPPLGKGTTHVIAYMTVWAQLNLPPSLPSAK